MCSLWELHGQAIASTHPEAAEKKGIAFIHVVLIGILLKVSQLKEIVL